MLFNSHIFLFFFLPLSLFLYYSLYRFNYKAALVGLVSCSLFFYGWWNPVYLVLLTGSITVNYSIGSLLISQSRPLYRRVLVWTGVLFNLGLLCYYKYADFFISSLNTISDANIPLQGIVLPLAISFFTFQQITYLVDMYKGDQVSYSFLSYCLFVTFFPQLIAGPIVHHRQMMSQFTASHGGPVSQRLALGITLFAIGLFKKVFIADNLALFSTPVFTAASSGASLGFFDGWGAALAYTGQLYFDFSGYSDMAVGLAHCFGITLPINFFSPYKARNISEFWQRWHITLSRFLRDYIYIPLGGNRVAPGKLTRNVIVTMFLGGLWHGAGWTFVFWGLLHGFYLAVFHFWKQVSSGFYSNRWFRRIAPIAAVGLTFLAVVIGWVFFRAEDFGTALHILHSMFLPPTLSSGLVSDDAIAWLVFAYAIIWLAPNPYEIMQSYKPALDLPTATGVSFLQWQPDSKWAFFTAVLLLLALLNLANVSEFLYFQF